MKSKLENVKNITLAKAVLLLLLLAISAQGQQDYGQTNPASQYLNEPYSTGQYSTTIPAGAPVPAMPESPQELGLSIPAEDFTYAQAPPATETGRALIAADSAYGADATSTGQSDRDSLQEICRKLRSTWKVMARAVAQAITPLSPWRLCLRALSRLTSCTYHMFLRR